MTTKIKILNAAEGIFAENGFAGTSIRNIVEVAEVNISAINYHFENKQGLFVAVVQRRFLELEKERLSQLNIHLENNSQPSVEGIVRAFLEPLTSRLHDKNAAPKMLFRAFGEKPELKEYFREHVFGNTIKAFIDAFSKALPELDHLQIQWRFRFMISTMMGMINFADELHSFAEEPKEGIVEFFIQQLLKGIEK